MKKGLVFSLFLTLCCLAIIGCKKKDAIIGQWSYDSGNSFVFTFNEDRSCSYAGKNCTYKLDGDKLIILYDGATETFDTTYKVEGNKLIIKDTFGKDVVYNKK